MKKIIFIGAGGYAKSAIDALSLYNHNIEGFIDDYKEGKHLGYNILGKDIDDIKTPKNYEYFISIGDNIKRKNWYDKLKNKGLNLINIVDPTAILSDNTQIGEGCFIGKMAIINSDVLIGNNCVINTKALVEHGCRIGNHVNISTNSVLNGDVNVKDGAFVGSCSVVNGQLCIGEKAMIGSGTVVIRDVESCSTVVGVPARKIK
ncbi:acetyltransferase [Paraclostridium bifermentans]|uniref:acetyltransferase n=1 Tax=Paraclostridium bifermentans TaxID=1490 RepID=UPI001F3A9804|nr:acetyltransferase [Paraclostridium bifermentans]MCE9675724.1 acetyltransferase [Paraclostridium bifermentans]MCR1876256.1 acetyltransferase [Paraclostridium bifermentans]